MLEKEKGGLTGLNREVLLYLGAFLAAEGRIGQDNVVAVFFLNIGQIFGQRIGMHDIGRFNAMQNHVHDADDISQRLLFFAVEGLFLQGFRVCGGEGLAVFEILERLHQEARGTHRAVIDLVADVGRDHFDDGLDERPGGVILAAVSPGIAHVLDLVFVQMRHLMLFGIGAKTQLVYQVDNFAQVVAALDLVF